MAKKKRASASKSSNTGFPPSLLEENAKLPYTFRTECLIDRSIWLIHNVLAGQECKYWIDHFESNDSEYVSQRQTRYLAGRECYRTSKNDDTMARRLFERIKSTRILESLENLFPGEEIVACNPNLRLYKYEKSMRFGKHIDESNLVEDGLTRFTVLFYLSSCKGGATRFEEDVAVIPQTGNMLIHVHGDSCLEHEADAVVSGTKYVLRTDLVCNRVS